MIKVEITITDQEATNLLCAVDQDDHSSAFESWKTDTRKSLMHKVHVAVMMARERANDRME